MKVIENRKLQKSISQDKYTPVLSENNRRSRFSHQHNRWDKDDALMNRSPYKHCKACSPQKEVKIKKSLAKKTVRPKTAKPVIEQPKVEEKGPSYDEYYHLRRSIYEAEMIEADIRHRSIMRAEADRMYHDSMIHHQALR